MFLLTTRLAAWPRLARREETWKTAEILILRHQLALLERQQPRRPKLKWADRALLATRRTLIPKPRHHEQHLLVTPDTILRWHRDIVRRRWTARSNRGKTGRPATRRNIRALVLRLARENRDWGYRRIHGERAGLGVRVPASTVWEILKNAGIDPAPRRSGPAWPLFLRSQAEAIAACGFFTAGLLDGTQAYVLAVNRARQPAHQDSRSHFASHRIVDRPASPEPADGPRRAGTSGHVHDPRPRLERHRCIRHGPRRCRDPDRALQRPDAPDERDRRTLDRRMPPRAPGPHARLEPGQSAADLAGVRDPPQSAPGHTAPWAQLRR